MVVVTAGEDGEAADRVVEKAISNYLSVEFILVTFIQSVEHNKYYVIKISLLFFYQKGSGLKECRSFQSIKWQIIIKLHMDQ